MKLFYWVWNQYQESIRPDQKPMLFVALLYCLSIIFDNTFINIPFRFFGVLIIAVGAGYLYSSVNSYLRIETAFIGLSWVFIGLINHVDYYEKTFGIPTAVLGSSIGYFVALCMIAFSVIQLKCFYINEFAYKLVYKFSFFMAIANVIAFFSVCVRVGTINFGQLIFIPIGNFIIYISKYSIIEFLSMFVVILSLFLQAPTAFDFVDIDE
jgi:hypothetical protein